MDHLVIRAFKCLGDGRQSSQDIALERSLPSHSGTYPRPRLLCQPTGSDVIQPKCPFRTPPMAVRQYRYITLQLSHQSRRHLHRSCVWPPACLDHQRRVSLGSRYRFFSHCFINLN
jgi:hypothetical protein